MSTAPKKFILIAEDEPMLQRAFKRMLGKRYLVKIVSSTEEAICVLRTVKCDAIISNWFLAGSSHGEDILDWIKKNQPENIDRFIFLTGYPLDRERYPRVVIKPPVMADFVHAIENVPHPDFSRP